MATWWSLLSHLVLGHLESAVQQRLVLHDLAGTLNACSSQRREARGTARQVALALPAGGAQPGARDRRSALQLRVRSPALPASTSFGLASSMRTASSWEANPPNTTEWMAPMRAPAVAATAAGNRATGGSDTGECAPAPLQPTVALAGYYRLHAHHHRHDERMHRHHARAQGDHNRLMIIMMMHDHHSHASMEISVSGIMGM